MILDCSPYLDKSGLSARLQSELEEALHFLNDCNIPSAREDRDPTFISRQVNKIAEPSIQQVVSSTER